jgi:hypothetical protein
MRRALLLIALVACDKSSGDPAPPTGSDPAPRQLAGVYPDQFKCESIATLDALGAVLGATTRVVDSASSVPKGVPHPCNYEVASTPLEYWTFDIDCRDGFKKRADGLFAQYRETSADLVHAYNELADAGAIKKTDAGIAIHAPVDAVDVPVGAKGLDHHGQGLLFIDDDAPCYVRVVGPDAQRRLLLAQLVAKNLTFANAPMTPRPMK